MLSTKGSAALQVNQIRAGAALSYVSMALSTVISLVYTPIMLRQLGDSEFGVYQAVLPIISYLNLLSFGLGSAYVRYYSRFRAAGDKKGCAKLNGMFLITYLILGALVLAIGFGLSYCDVVFGKKLTAEEIDLAQRLLRIMSVNAALTFPISVFESHVTINERYLFQKIVAMGKQVLNPLIMIPLLLIGYRSVTLTIVSLIFTVLSGVINITYCLTRLKMPFAFRHYDFALLREMFGFTLYVFIGIVVDNINWSIDRQLLTWFHGSAAVTVYVIASQLNNYFLLFGNAISNVMTPRVHRLVAENAPMRTLDALFTKVGRLQFILLGGIFLGFVAIGQSFVVLWGGGEQFRIDYWTALLLFFACLWTNIQTVGIEIQRAKNMHKYRSLVYLGVLVGNIVISIPLCMKWQGLGAAIGTAVATLVGNVFLMNRYYYKHIGLNIPGFWRHISHLLPAMVLPTTVAVLLAVSFSRLYLGVHTPLDVGVSFAVAGVMVLALYPLIRQASRRPRLMAGLLAGMLLAGTAYLVFAYVHPFPADVDPANLTSGRENGWKLLGATVGFGISWWLDRRYIRFDTRAVWWVQLLKVVLGLALLMGIRAGLKAPLLALLHSPGVAGAVRYGIMVLFAGALWPAAFRYMARWGRKA